MCGIAGYINVPGIEPHQLIAALHHRGPDAQGIYIDKNLTLVHTRLAIQDVQQGYQPFHFQQYTMIFNGEIYNHLELRKKLNDFQFKTDCDTETLLYLFIKYRFNMFDLLDGMYAFCVYDKNTHELILARDRAGKKPLYYSSDQYSFCFASELNAIKTIKKLNVNSEAIACYLRAGFIWGPFTPYKNLFELEAGSYLILDLHSVCYKKKSYFNLCSDQVAQNSNLNFATCLDELEKRLTKSIESRLLASDVEVGVFLSGGIDSNLIAAIAAKIKPNIKTFTVKFSDGYDESHLARYGAQKYRTQHIELSIQNELNEIEKILQCYGEPFMDSSAIPSYFISQAASRHVKVVLSGDGADELFAGYRRYVAIHRFLMAAGKMFYPFLKFLPKPHEKKSFYNYFYRLLAMLNKKGLDFYLSATTDIFEDIYSFSVNSILYELGQFVETILQDAQIPLLQKMLVLDFNLLLFSDLLVKMDIASMANSLEVRSPFLGKDLLQFAPQIPDRYKIHHTQTKYILRKLSQKYLPPQLIHQPKLGFEVPLKTWVDNDLKERIFSALSAGCYSENYIDKKLIDHLLMKNLNISAEKRAKMLWSLYCLEVWHQHDKNYFYS